MTRAAGGETADVVCVASWNADLVSRVARPMARGETLMASSFSISPGGKAAMPPWPQPARAPASR